MLDYQEKYYLYRHIRLDKNEPFYIGIGTLNPKRKGIKDSCLYQRAYQKGGRGDIWNKITNKTKYEVEVIFSSNDYDFIKQKEIEFIKLYGRKNLGTGILANLTDGGEGMHGYVFTKEHKEKIRQTKKQLIKDRGFVHTQEALEKMKQAIIGRVCTIETRQKISKKNKEHNTINNALSFWKKPVLQFDLNNTFIKEYSSLTEAGKELNISFKLIHLVCKGKRKKTHGFKFKYKE